MAAAGFLVVLGGLAWLGWRLRNKLTREVECCQMWKQLVASRSFRQPAIVAGESGDENSGEFAGEIVRTVYIEKRPFGRSFPLR